MEGAGHGIFTNTIAEIVYLTGEGRGRHKVSWYSAYRRVKQLSKACFR